MYRIILMKCVIPTAILYKTEHHHFISPFTIVLYCIFFIFRHLKGYLYFVSIKWEYKNCFINDGQLINPMNITQEYVDTARNVASWTSEARCLSVRQEMLPLEHLRRASYHI